MANGWIWLGLKWFELSTKIGNCSIRSYFIWVNMIWIIHGQIRYDLPIFHSHVKIYYGSSIWILHILPILTTFVGALKIT